MSKLVFGFVIHLFSVMLFVNCQGNANNAHTYIDNQGITHRFNTGEIVLPVRSTYSSQIAFEQYKNKAHLSNLQIEDCRLDHLTQNECFERYIPQYAEVGSPTDIRTGSQKIKPLNGRPLSQPQISTTSRNPTDISRGSQNFPSPLNNNYDGNDEIRQPNLNIQDQSHYNLHQNGNQRPIKPQYNPVPHSNQYDQQSNFEQQQQIMSNNRKNIFIDYAPITKFAWNLFQANHPLQYPGSNFVFSGLSPQLLLSYLSTVSEGKTKKEILGAISYPDPNQLDKFISDILKENSNRQLQIASAFFVTREMEKTINQTFLDESSDRNVETVFVNFKNPVETTKIIDRWITRRTKDQITSIKASYAPTMRILLSSVIHFKGNWFYEFNDAVSGKFRLNRDDSKIVEMMTLRKKLKTNTIKIGNADVRWLELPYKSLGESMIIIVPVGDFGLDRIINFMQSEAITNLIDTIQLSDDEILSNVNLTIPKFSISSTVSLVDSLKKMGIRDMFTPNSDIPYLSTNENVQISNVQQQSVLEINEIGSISSSVTTFSVIALSYTPPIPNIVVKIDQPFLAIIVDKNNKVPLFIAEVNEP